jgi:hypothetical protein
VDLGGFDLTEVGARNWRTLWVRGGLPRSYLARSEALSVRWRRDFVRTFLERDVPQLGIRIPAEVLRRTWMMLAHVHGQVWNGADIARSLTDLELDRAWIVYPGGERYPAHAKVEVLPLTQVPDRLAFLGGPARAAKRSRNGQAR